MNRNAPPNQRQSEPPVRRISDDYIEKTEHPTNYFMALMHLLKGNLGPGLFAMGFAFKHGGIAVSAALTIVLAIVCVHCQHMLVTCSVKIREIGNLSQLPDFARTVEYCFVYGPEKTRKLSKFIKITVNVFICVTQLGFCCVYFVFIATNVNQVLIAHANLHLDVRIIMVAAFLPIWLSSLITSLKFLTPISAFAATCMFLALVGTFWFAFKDGYISDIKERNLYTEPLKLAIYFGTAVFAFEGIALVLPIKISMKNPDDFEKAFGVLNVGMFIVTTSFTLAGLIGYSKWGEDVAGSLSLNLGNSILAEITKMTVTLGVLFGYALQFHIALQIMLPRVIHCVHGYNHQFTVNLVFRTFMVIVTLCIAILVPALGLFISLIGSLCSTALALVFPPLIHLMVCQREKKIIFTLNIIKDMCILIVAVLGFSVGTYQSLYEIIEHFDKLHLSDRH